MISYDIPEGNPSYAKVIEFLEEDLEARRILKSQWLITHEGDSDAILSGFKSRVQEDDRILVQRVAARDFASMNPMLPEDDLTILLYCEGDD
jgi:hypothetical protein